MAIKHVTEYLGFVGRGGTRYEDALSLLNRAERAKADAEARAKRQKAVEERARAEAEAARKRAEAEAAEAAREKDCDEVADNDGYLSPSVPMLAGIGKACRVPGVEAVGILGQVGHVEQAVSRRPCRGIRNADMAVVYTRSWYKGKGTMRAGKPTGHMGFPQPRWRQT